MASADIFVIFDVNYVVYVESVFVNKLEIF